MATASEVNAASLFIAGRNRGLSRTIEDYSDATFRLVAHRNTARVGHARIPDNILNESRDPLKMCLGDTFGSIHVPGRNRFEKLLMTAQTVGHDPRDGNNLSQSKAQGLREQSVDFDHDRVLRARSDDAVDLHFRIDEGPLITQFHPSPHTVQGVSHRH